MSICSAKKCLNIVLIEYINRNLGDTAIAECAAYFLREVLEEAGIHNYRIHEYNMYNRDMEYIRRADLLIFAGGGLVKYKREKFHEFLPEIVEEAEKNNIPVYLNCVGVEGYDSEDVRCVRLKEALNLPCVKGITVRDDFQTLKNSYLEKEKEWLASVLDPVAFAQEVYGCKGEKKGSTIGLGIAESKLYANYGYLSADKQFQLDFWKEIIHELEMLGYDWQIFGNGLYQDCEFEMEVLEYTGKIGEKEKYLAKRPTEAKELAEQIAGYKGIIATRLHANIIAYSMKVPSIGLVWNDKMLYWGEKIGYPERFMKIDSSSPREIVAMLEKAMDVGVKYGVSREAEKIKRPLREFVNQYGNLTVHNKDAMQGEVFAWEDHLIASALGGMRFQYRKMNSPVTFLDKYENGFRWFEVDVKLTTDGKLVCVNGWTSDTFAKLNCRERKMSFLGRGIAYDEFMGRKYYEHYKTMDYGMFTDLIRGFPDIKVVLDARDNSTENMGKIVGIIRKNLLENPNMKNELIIRVSSPENIQCVFGLRDRVAIMYDIPSGEADNEKEGDFWDICSDPRVQYLSFSKKSLSSELISKAQEHNKKTCVYVSNSLSEVKEFFDMGVDFVETEYLIVNALKHLI